MNKDIVWHNHEITKEDRNKLLNQKSILLWFTGLSGSGKSTIANELQKKLIQDKKLVYILDGDNIRHGLNSDLGFSKEEREENIRRIGEVGKLFVDAGVITIACFISPYKKDRNKIRKKLDGNFIEVFIKCNLEECKIRDPKKLYKKAIEGEIKNFTGISDPYEKPENPELVIETDKDTVNESVKKIYDFLKEKDLI